MKIAILAVAAMFPLLAGAQDYCLEVRDAAKAVMINRLSGIDQARQQDLARDMLDGDELRVVRALIKDAYVQPDSRDKARASDSFALTWMIKCSRGDGF